jgi:hypothetical protein
MTKDVSYIIVACYPDKGMKSHGSKSLIDFNKKKLLQHQIDCISKTRHKNYEIIVISDFETQKIKKLFPLVKVIELNNNNPIYLGCKIAKYQQIVFIDYGCLFSGQIINEIKNNSTIICSGSTKISGLEVGCLVRNRFLEHLFLDLPDNQFCNIFSLSHNDKKKILQNNALNYFNLLSFEVINKLIELGSIFDVKFVDSEDFIHFNNMRQKNAIHKFIKKTY